MRSHLQKDNAIWWIASLSVLSFLIHLSTRANLSFHRDELLYLALGRHLSAGYWSNPPLIGLISYISQLLPFDDLLNTRIIPALAGSLLVFLTGITARELGGRRFAQVLAPVALLSSIIFLRAYSMLMPVPFDILLWTLFLFLLLRYVNSGKKALLLVMGLVFGIGMLNKYMMVFLVTGLAAASVFTPLRRLWREKYFWLAAAIALLVFLPNLVWQIRHHFPVAVHMDELARTQLVNVDRLEVLIEQLLLLFGSSVIWIAGLVWLLTARKVKRYRVFGYTYLLILAMILLLRGKNYYTAGLYPFFVAAGAVSWEKLLQKAYLRVILVCMVLLLNLPLVPGGIPIGKASFLSAYFYGMYERTGIDALLRWEDGKIHSLPQDYADRLGWDELGQLVNGVMDTLKTDTEVMVFCENYGQAGAIELYAGVHDIRVVSFSDSYQLWVPDSLPALHQAYLYVNDEVGGDVASLFSGIDSVGCVTNIYAREQGTTVWLLKGPDAEFGTFWSDRVKGAKAAMHP